MDVGAVRELIGEAVLVDVAACRAELVAIRSVRGALDARHVQVVARLDELAETAPSMFPDAVVAESAKSSPSSADRVRRRGRAAAGVPELGEALASGATTGERLDRVAGAMAGLSAAQRARFVAHGAELAWMAEHGSEREFRALLARVVRAVTGDDGLDRLARQRRSARARWWTDAEGMWCLSGRFDPVAGVELQARLEAVKAELGRDGRLAGGPSDPLERDQWLRALALHLLATGRWSAGHGEAGSGDAPAGAPSGGSAGGPAGGSGGPGNGVAGGAAGPGDGGASGSGSSGGGGGADVVVVIDAESMLSGRWSDRSWVDVSWTRAGVPVEAIRRWACQGTVTPVVVGAEGTRLFVGRESRLATRAQRRALRVLYGTCALCDVEFDRCEIHHVTPFVGGGSTDIHDLLPVCDRDHHRVHEGGWTLTMAADRTLTLTAPDGTQRCIPPPRAQPTTRAG